jgi:hypothetical protein
MLQLAGLTLPHFFAGLKDIGKEAFGQTMSAENSSGFFFSFGSEKRSAEIYNLNQHGSFNPIWSL